MSLLAANFLNQSFLVNPKGQRYYEPEATLHNGSALLQVASQLWQATQHLKYTALMAHGAGAGPLAAAIALQAAQTGITLNILQLKAAKRYPERSVYHSGQVPIAGTKVLLVDDAVFTGASLRQCMAQLSAAKIAVNIVGAAVFYDDAQLYGSRKVHASGVPIFSALTRFDLGLTRKAFSDAPVLAAQQWLRIGFALHRGRACAPAIAATPQGPIVLLGDDSCRLWGIDLATGEQRWCIEPTAVHPKGINNDFLIIDGQVFYGTYAGELTCADTSTGAVVWRRKIDHALHSAPVLDAQRNVLYINCESSHTHEHGHVRAISASTGEALWAYPHQAFCPCQAAFDGQRIFATANDQTLIALDGAGKFLWKSKTQGLVRGAVYADTANQAVITCSETGHVRCFAADTGHIRWTRRVGAASNHVAPVLYQGALVVSDSAGHLAALNPATGKIVWMSRLRSATSWRPSPLGPRASDGFIVTTCGGNLATFDANGTKLREQKTAYLCFAPAAVASGRAVFLTIQGHLVCYDLNDQT